MPLKPHITSNVPPLKIRSHISPEFHELLDDSLLQAKLYTVISFPGMRGASSSIVDSKSLAKALHKCLPTNNGLFAVAHSFTAEAKDMLSNLNAVYFFTSDHYWSDESWARIRDK